MIMKLRQPDRRRFKSSIRERRKREREYFYSAVTVLVVKIILFVFLVLLVDVSYRMFNHRFAHLPTPARLAVPALVAAFAIANIFFIYKNIKQLIALDRERKSAGRRDAG